LTLQARLFQLPVALSMDLRLSAHEHVLPRDVSNGTVQADVVAMLDATMNQALRIVWLSYSYASESGSTSFWW
jgi:hypothetical protein